LTVNLRGKDGMMVLKRPVSRQWEKVRAFFADLAENAGPEDGFLAILEVCGRNPWLREMMREYGQTAKPQTSQGCTCQIRQHRAK